MPTSVLWRRDKTPAWGDQALERGLTHWGVNVNPIEAKFLFRGLLYSTLAVPVDPQHTTMEEGAVLRLAQDESGVWGVPIFTSPTLLNAYAARIGWTPPGGEAPWTAVQGKEAFKTLAQIENIECWINPGSCTLRLDQEALKILSEGQIPDPKRLGAARRTHAASNEAGKIADFRSAENDVPDRVRSAIKLTLEQFPLVVSATLYKNPTGEMILGIKTPDLQGPETDKAVSALERMFLKNNLPISVTILSPEMQATINRSVPPFYWRKT
jgi:hypothetical protein